MSHKPENKGPDDALAAGRHLRVVPSAEETNILSAAATVAGGVQLEEVLAPLAALEPGYVGPALGAALQAVSGAAKSLSQADRGLLKSEVIRHLKRIKAPGPSDLAKSYFAAAKEETEQSQLTLDPTPLHDEAQNGEDVLNAVVAVLRRYVIWPPGAAIAVSLWLAHTYAVKALSITPRLALLSPTKRCGKSTALALLGHLAEKPLPATSISAAAFFRLVEQYQPTIIADEADTWIRDNEDLRNLLNSGFYRPQAVVYRCVGDDHNVFPFQVFGPLALAGIGRIPDTVADRSVIIELQRRGKGEKVERLRLDRLPAETGPLKRRLARWVSDHLDELSDLDPDVPERLHDRAQDLWRPLLAIADLAGGKWPDQARRAALQLAGAAEAGAEDVKTLLVEDVAALFQEKKEERLPTQTILEYLHGLDERPWSEWRRGKPLSPRGLARLLKSFGVQSKNIRTHLGPVVKGYHLVDLTDAFSRYLGDSRKKVSSESPLTNATALQVNNEAVLSQKPTATTPTTVADEDEARTPQPSDCSGVADSHPFTEQKENTWDEAHQLVAEGRVPL